MLNSKFDIFINVKLLLALTLVSLSFIYYIFLDLQTIRSIILDEYILLGVITVFSFIVIYFKIKLKEYIIMDYLPNINTVSLKQASILFIIFCIIDFYSEGGLTGMIKLWFMYWLFAIVSWQVMNIINYYKNYKFYI